MTDPTPRLAPSGRFVTGGSSAAAVPLSSALYVDLATTVPNADRNGAIVTPFAALAPAYAAALGGSALLLAPTVSGASYAALTLDKALTVQSVDAAPEPSYLSAPAQTVETECDGFTIHDVAASFVGLTITDLALPNALASVALDACRVAALLSVSTTQLYAQNCVFTGSADVLVLFARSCSFASLIVTDGSASLFDCTISGTFTQTGAGFCELHGTQVLDSITVAGGITIAGGCSVDIVNAVGGGFLLDSSCVSVTCDGDFVARNARIDGPINVSSGNVDIRFCQLGGNVVLGEGSNLTIDVVTYLAALQAGHSFTVPGVLTVIGTTPQVVSSGYTFAAPLVLTLQPVGHAPGLYAVGGSEVISTAGTSGTATSAITFSAPTVGPQSVVGNDLLVTPAGSESVDPIYIQSDGGVAIQVTFTPAAIVGSPVADVYMAAWRVGA